MPAKQQVSYGQLLNAMTTAVQGVIPQPQLKRTSSAQFASIVGAINECACSIMNVLEGESSHERD